MLDEVDAALDNTNVAKVANYIRAHASDVFQFIVISLKGSLYERGHSLVGIYRDQEVNSSRTLTLDVSRCPCSPACWCSACSPFLSRSADTVRRVRFQGCLVPVVREPVFFLLYNHASFCFHATANRL